MFTEREEPKNADFYNVFHICTVTVNTWADNYYPFCLYEQAVIEWTINRTDNKTILKLTQQYNQDTT